MAPDLPLFAALDPPQTAEVATGHRLRIGPFSALAEDLFDSVERLQADDPFRRVEIVVSSNFLAVDLRRRLGEWEVIDAEADLAVAPEDLAKVFDAAGKVLKAWGEKMFVWPHGIRVDRDGFGQARRDRADRDAAQRVGVGLV